MARPWKIHERLLAETQKESESKTKRNRRRKEAANQSQNRIVKIEKESDDGVFTGDEWEPKYLTKRKLYAFARTKEIPLATIRELIKRRKLEPLKLPGYRWEKYSVRQLQALIKNYNKIFIVVWLAKAAIVVMGIFTE